MRRNGAASTAVVLTVMLLGVLGAPAVAVVEPAPPTAVGAPAPPTAVNPRRTVPDPLAPSPSTSVPTVLPTVAPTPVPSPTAPVPPPATNAPPPVAPTSRPTPTAPAESPPAPASTSTPVVPDERDAGGGVAPQQRSAIPPTVTTTSTPWAQLLVALAVVVAGAVAVVVLSARRERAAAGDPSAQDAAAAPVEPASPDEVLRVMVTAGEAMIDAGHTVSSVADTLEDIAATHGIRGAEAVVLPTALLVSVPTDASGTAVATAVVSTGRRPLLLHQVDDLADVLRDATTRSADLPTLTTRLAALRTVPAPFGTLARLGGYLMISVGLAALLGGSWVDILVAGVLGLAVGALQLAVGPRPRDVEVVLTVAAAFAVATAVLVLARLIPDLGVLPAIIAPLVLFLPGGLLTTGVIELATGQMLSGAGRVAAGTMQLVLLAGGIVGASALVGVPAIDLSVSDLPLGPIAPWVGVALFGAGTVVFRCGRPQTIGWVVLVLVVAYGAQVVGDALFGGVLSAFVGAFAMTPMALAVARFPSGPSPLVSFLPAFWMLVPGALGLVGVTSLLDGDGNGLSTLVTTAATMVAIALGVLLGLSAARALPGTPRRRGPSGGVPATTHPPFS